MIWRYWLTAGVISGFDLNERQQKTVAYLPWLKRDISGFGLNFPRATPATDVPSVFVNRKHPQGRCGCFFAHFHFATNTTDSQKDVDLYDRFSAMFTTPLRQVCDTHGPAGCPVTVSQHSFRLIGNNIIVYISLTYLNPEGAGEIFLTLTISLDIVTPVKGAPEGSASPGFFVPRPRGRIKSSAKKEARAWASSAG